MLRRHIGNYNFVGDAKTGITLRWGKTINDNPIFAPVPELADISISNHCTKDAHSVIRIVNLIRNL